MNDTQSTVLMVLCALALTASLAVADLPNGSTKPSVPAASGPAGKHVRVLAIGNSFSSNAMAFLPRMVAASGNKITIGHARIGGCSLATHWGNVEASEKNPQMKHYTTPDGKTRMSLRDFLTLEEWDYVTIQQVSKESLLGESYQPYADNLVSYIRRHAPQAKILIHQTWAYRPDHAFFSDGKPSYIQMYEGLRRNYYGLAKRYDAGIMPVGDAFELARLDEEWAFKLDRDFDFKSPKHPQMPKVQHSLHMGYRWKQNQNNEWQLAQDGHANGYGCYLGSAVWYAKLFETSPVGNKFKPSGLTIDEVACLQRIAAQALEQSLKSPPADPTTWPAQATPDK